MWVREEQEVRSDKTTTRDYDFERPKLSLEGKAESKDPVIGRLLGTTEDTGKLLGLEKDWLANAVKATGNYGEIFERNVGPKSPLKLPRGVNNLWDKGGLMYAPPVR
jgi:general L-amino acid transport system substrate-binding protein